MTRTKRCEKRGAPRFNWAALFCTAWLGLAMAVPAHASELGNIFNGDAEAESRKASAQALEGLEAVFAGLRQRELQNHGGGKEAFDKAVADFKEAAAQMKDVRAQIKADHKINWTLMAQNDLRIIKRTLKRLGGKNLPETESELYDVFIAATDQLAATIGKQEHKQNTSILPLIAGELTGYIHLGAAVTNISRKLNAIPVSHIDIRSPDTHGALIETHLPA